MYGLLEYDFEAIADGIETQGQAASKALLGLFAEWVIARAMGVAQQALEPGLAEKATAAGDFHGLFNRRDHRIGGNGLACEDGTGGVGRRDEIPIIVTERGMARKRIDSWFKKRKTKPNIYAQVAGNESILAMVSMGFGIGIVPELILRENFINRNVQVLNIKPELMPYSVGICVQKKRMANPVVRAFWDKI